MGDVGKWATLGNESTQVCKLTQWERPYLIPATAGKDLKTAVRYVVHDGLIRCGSNVVAE